MAVAHRDTQTTTTGSTSCSLTKPTGTATDDILIACIARADASDAVTMSGFTQLALVAHDGGSLWVGWKRAGGSEPSSYSASWTTSTNLCASISAYSGAHTTNAPTIATTTGSSNTPDPPTNNPGSSAERMCVAIYGIEGKANTSTEPSLLNGGAATWNERCDLGATGGGSPTAWEGLSTADTLATASSYDPGTFTSSNNDGWASATVLIDPPAAVSITPNEAAHGHTADGATITQTHAITPAEASHAHAADGATITQTHVIAANEAIHAHAADGATVTLVVSITPNESLHAHLADGATVTQTHVISAAEAAHAHAADGATITQTHVVSADEATHGHLADGATITQTHVVSAAESLHGHAADAAIITQTHVISAAEATHAHTADQAAVTVAAPATAWARPPSAGRIRMGRHGTYLRT